jgi:hypothetical protein
VAFVVAHAPALWSQSQPSTSLQHRLELEWAAETESTEEDQKLELVYQPTLDANSKHCRFVTQLRLRGDAYDDLEPGVPEYGSYSDYSERQFLGTQADAELRELWLRCGGGHFFLTLGKQQIVWGKADGLKILDVVNPQSFREFILDDFEDSRIPLWSVNAEISFGSSTLQLVFLPDTTYHELPEVGATFYLQPRLDLSATTFPQGDLSFGAPTKPDDAIEDADFGARFSTFAAGWDLSLVYFRHYDDTPVLRLDVEEVSPRFTFTPSYVRSDLYGFTFSNAFGDLTLRGEVGFTPDKGFSPEKALLIHSSGDSFDFAQLVDGVIESDELAYVLGFDWYGLTQTLISVQGFESRLSEDNLPLFRPRVDRNLTGLVRWWNQTERFQIEMLWIHGLEYDDGIVRPKLRYAWNDSSQVYLGYDLFYGDAAGNFGQFDDRDRFRIGLRFDF